MEHMEAVSDARSARSACICTVPEACAALCLMLGRWTLFWMCLSSQTFCLFHHWRIRNKFEDSTERRGLPSSSSLLVM